MAKKETGCSYSREVKNLKSEGPLNLYLLYGEEDYLRESFFSLLLSVCIPEGESSFSFRRFEGPELDVSDFAAALDQMPFMTERSFILLKDVDINKAKDSEALIAALDSIPDYCTVCFVQSSQYSLDGRIKLVKYLKEHGNALYFTNQDSSDLKRWITKRFAALNKSISSEAAERLIFVSGDLMNRLIPEIEKIAAYSSGTEVTLEDVNAVASHIPEADVFEMIGFISQKKFDHALHILSELLRNKDNSPIAILSAIGFQFRRLFGVKLAMVKRLPKSEIMEIFSIRWEGIANQTIAAAKSFSLSSLRKILEDCAECEYRMKSTGSDDVQALKEIIISIMTGEYLAED